MMKNQFLDDYLQAYKGETDIKPSRALHDAILAIPGQAGNASSITSKIEYIILKWFDLFLPKAVGWALTLCLGVYLGLASSEPVFNVAEAEFYLNDQAQFILSEDVLTEELVIEGNEK